MAELARVLIVSDNSNYRNTLRIQTNLAFGRKNASCDEIIEAENLRRACLILQESKIKPGLILVDAKVIKTEITGEITEAERQRLEVLRSNDEDVIPAVIFSNDKSEVGKALKIGWVFLSLPPLDMILFNNIIWESFFTRVGGLL